MEAVFRIVRIEIRIDQIGPVVINDRWIDAANPIDRIPRMSVN